MKVKCPCCGKTITYSKATRTKKTIKEIRTETYVDNYTRANGYPPTYREIAKRFYLKGVSAAYARCEKFRFKLISRVGAINSKTSAQ